MNDKNKIEKLNARIAELEEVLQKLDVALTKQAYSLGIGSLTLDVCTARNGAYDVLTKEKE